MTVERLAETLGLTVVEQLAGGAFGAFLVDFDGTPCVLKVLPYWTDFALDKVERALDLVAALRERGYPAPRYLAVGRDGEDVYTVQEYVAGNVPASLTEPIARELLPLWRTHSGMASRGGETWALDLVERVRGGEELRLRTDDRRVHAVLDRVLEVGAAADPGVFRTGDVVHGDFHPGNVLVRDGRLAAVFDWEGARAGDSRADLVRAHAAAASWLGLDHPAVTHLGDELAETTPDDVRLPIGAEIAVHHLRYGLFAKPSELDWVLREAEILLSPRIP